MKHETLCPYPQHPRSADCTYCVLIRKSTALGYENGRNDAAKEVREFMMMRFGVAYVNTVNDVTAVAKGVGLHD